MRRSLEEFVFSIECVTEFPFFKLMSVHRMALSPRLNLTVFIGSAGRPKRFIVRKIRGLKDRLQMSDTANVIGFPAPEESFRTILTQEARALRQKMGGYTWAWSSDGMTLLAFDDMEFHFMREEAMALDKVIFGNNFKEDPEVNQK